MNHSFDVAVAEQVGVNAAVLFQSIAFWCQHSATNGKNYYDGCFWTYSSNKAFQKVFPYLTSSQIETALKKLIDAGLIIKGNYNKSAYDRTMWYTVTETGMSMLGIRFENNQESISEKSEMENGKIGNQFLKNREPIPVTIKDTIKDTVVVNAESRNVTETYNDNNDDYNPFGDAPDHPNLNTIEVYASNNTVNMRGGNMDSLHSYCDVLGEPLVRYAIDQANRVCKTGVPTWGYVETILQGFIAQKIETVEQAKAVETNRKESQNTRSSPKRPTAAQESDAFWSKVPFV